MDIAANLFYFKWEILFMEWFQAAVTWEPLKWLLNILSVFGEEIILVALMGIFYWGFDKERGKIIGTSAILATVFNPLIKNIFLRLRPYFCSDKIELLRKIDTSADTYDVSAQGYSFPSGHSTNAAAVYGTIAALFKKTIFVVIAATLCLATGLSRIYVGAHFPTDVICGWLLGMIITLFVVKIFLQVKNKALIYVILLLICMPGFFYCKSTDYYTSYGMMIGTFAGFLFEERYVNFKSTPNAFIATLRTVIGGGLFFGLNELFKLPFPKEFLDTSDFSSFLIRTIRYAVVLFIVVAIYPMAFSFFNRKNE